MESEKQNLPPQSAKQSELSLRDLLLTLYESKWLIIIFTFLFCSISAMTLLQKPHIFESTALIQIENKPTSMGQLEGAASLFDMKASPSDVQKALLSSPFILEPVISQLALCIKTAPHYMLYLGNFIQKHPDLSRFIPKWPFLSRYSWGNEQIKADIFEVPAEYLKKNFRIIVDEDARSYKLYDPTGQYLLSAKVGELATTAPGNSLKIKILISQWIAHPRIEFFIQKNSKIKEVADLQQNLTITDVGASTKISTQTGILQLSLKGYNPQKLAAILNQIIQVAVQKDNTNKSVEAAKTLNFLNQQLPVIKNSLSEAELALNEYRAKNGKINLTVESHLLLDRVAEIETKINQTQLQKNELLQYYTDVHPFVVALVERQRQLQRELTHLQTLMKKLPSEDQVALSLSREVRVKNHLYLLLSQKMQELQVIAAGTVSDIRVLSFAKIPEEPISNKTLLKLIAALIAGLMLGCLAAAIRKSLHQKIYDPRWVEQNLGVIIAAVIPYSKKQVNNERLIKKGLIHKPPLLALNASYDLSIESLRSLRTHLHFCLQTSNNNIVAITGISPQIGKSFVASNFAYLLADINKKILLIDGDIRRGHLYKYFNLKQSPGLSEVLSGECSLAAGVQVFNENLHVLTAGSYKNKPAELLMSNRFNDIIQLVSHGYDTVIIDTAPILAVTDGVIVAKHAGVNFFLVGSGMHHAEEIEFAIKRMYSNEIKIHGVIFNNIRSEAGINSYGKYRYRYYYNYENV